MIPEDWEVLELKKTAYVNMGQSPSSDYYSTDKKHMPFLQGVKTFGSIYPNFDIYCSNPVKIANKGELLLSVRAPVGDLNIANREICIGRGVTSINSKKSENRFLFYLLRCYKNQILNFGNGSVFDSINKKEIENLKLPFPSLKEQKSIAKILSDLDEKIEVNRNMNEILQELGQTLYKRWFVDFEFPDEKGKPYKSSGGKMVESEFGEIPEGWEVEILGDLFKFIKGKKPLVVSEKYIEGYLPQILIENLDGKDSLYANIEKSVIAESDDPIMVMDGASSGRIEIGYEGILGSTLASLRVLEKRNKMTIYYFLKNKEEDIRNNTTGTSIPHVDKSRVQKYQIALPKNKRIIEQFQKSCSRIKRKIILNKEEMKDLSNIRDILLPKLMTGKIRVSLEVNSE